MRPHQDLHQRSQQASTPSPKTRPQNQLQVRAQALLLSSTAVAVCMALLLLIHDFRQWDGAFSGFSWELSKERVQPGEWILATIRIPEVDQPDRMGLRLVLPGERGYRFVPGSLEVLSGSLVGARIPGFSGERELIIESLPVQTQPLLISVAIQIPEDPTLLGTALKIAPELLLEGQPVATNVFRESTVWIRTKPLDIQTKVVPAQVGTWAYEVSITNPLDGIDYSKNTETPHLVFDLQGPGADLIPEAVQVLSAAALHPPRIQDGQFFLDRLPLKPGEEVTVVLPVEAGQRVPSDVRGQAKLWVQDYPLGQTEPVRGQRLPVTWRSWEGEPRGNRALLRWEIAREIGNKGFQVEHKYKDHDFRAVAFVPGTGNLREDLIYQYETEPLPPGRHLFRLQQQGFDGQAHHTQQIEVFIGIETPAEIDAQPMAAENGGFFQCRLRKSQPVKVWLTDARGLLLRNLFEGHMLAMVPYDIFMSTTGLNPGWYQIKLEGTATEQLQPVEIRRSP